MSNRGRGNMTLLTGCLLGIGTAIVVSAIGVWLLTEMMIRQSVGEGSEVILIPAFLTVATFAGNQVSSAGQNKHGINTPLTMSAILAILLLIVGLLLDGPFNMIGYNLLAIGIGCCISCVISLKRPRNRRTRKRGYR